MTSVAVLGAGRVGAVIARDLAADHDVTVLDASTEALSRLRDLPGLRTVLADLTEPAAVTAAVEGFDLVIGALPGWLGYRSLEAVIAAAKPVVDISFMPEDPRALHEEAMSRGVTAVVDCGVAPGISNMLVGRAAARLDRLDTVRILVGGLPRVRRWPYEYKAGFSPVDVLEEYTRQARVVAEGRVLNRPALSDVEALDLPGVGTVEAFLTDGLRSLVDTVQVRRMEEKTIRYPGHAELMRVLRESGFFGEEPIRLENGTRVRPRELTSRLLFPLWKYEDDEEDLTVMRIEIEGDRDGARTRIVHEMLDAFDRETATTSMARTTAFPCAIVARMVASGELAEPGVLPPEVPAREPGFWERVSAELEARGVRVSEREAAP